MEVFPDIDIDLVTVSVIYPGASPSDIENSICIRIEEKVQGLKGIKNTNKIIIAYEPVWSIGSGIVPSRNELEKNIKNIKKILKQFKFKNSVKILYGGSVNSKNANEISKIDGIGGLLVGGASLNSKKFVDIIKKTSN